MNKSWQCINELLLHNKLSQTNSLKKYYLLLLKIGNSGVIQLSVLAQGFMRLSSSEALTWAHNCWNQFPCWLLGESLSSFTWASLLGYMSGLKILLSWPLEWVSQEDEQGGCSAFYDLVSDTSFSFLQYSNVRKWATKSSSHVKGSIRSSLERKDLWIYFKTTWYTHGHKVVYILLCPKCIFLPMLSNNLAIIALTWSSGPFHLSQFQIWIRVYLCNISSVQSLSCVLPFATQWAAARQASLPTINSRSMLKLKSIELVMPSNHLILRRPLLLLSLFSPLGPFPMGRFFASGSQSIGTAASASVLPMNMQDWFTLGLRGLISL